MILLIDNYDSFSYNLVQLFGGICEEKRSMGTEEEIKVIRNDDYTVSEIKAMKPNYIVLSPGPGRPSDAGVCEELVKEMKGYSKILGVCLGHQGICEAFGGNIVYAKCLMHGKQSELSIVKESPIFKGLPRNINVGRYHSLAVEASSLPEEFEVIAIAKDGEVMAVKHKEYEIYGLQFHPESVLTPQGRIIIENFLS